METRCDLDFGTKSAVSTSRVEIYNTNDADVPLLSITAPSEEVSEVEDNLGSSTSQTPAREQTDDAREEAVRIVGDVLTQASEILQSQTTPVVKVVENSVVEVAVYSSSKDNNLETKWSDDDERDKLKNNSEIRNVAHQFVIEILQKALEEANRRLCLNMEKHARRGSREHLMELNEIIETMSSGSGDKRRPWYRRARTSASKLLQRLCVCGRANR